MRRTRVWITTLAVCVALLGGASLWSAPRGLAQQASPPRPSHIHSGSCEELGPIVQPLSSLTGPASAPRGNADAVTAEAAFTNIPQSLDQLLADDFAIKVHLSKEQIQTYLVCGDIGGSFNANGELIIGLKEVAGSGYTGIAYLVPAADGSTNVSVLIAKVIGGAPPAAPATTPAAGESTATAAAGTPNVVGVALSEFSIAMPSEIPAGPTRFNVTNVGTVPHSFVIEGEGISERLADNVPPRQTGTLELDLKPGTYTVYCPVGNGAHRAKGMEVSLTVK